MDVSTSDLSLGNILEDCAAPPWVEPEEKGNQSKILIVKNWISIWDDITLTLGAITSFLGGRTRRSNAY